MMNWGNNVQTIMLLKENIRVFVVLTIRDGYIGYVLWQQREQQ